MIKSMTGYGGAKSEGANVNISVELKSVNNRYLDCNIRIPRGYMFAEEAIKSEISSSISRGKVDVNVSVDFEGADSVEVSVNEALAKSYLDAINDMTERFSLESGLTAYLLGRLPDVITTQRSDPDRDEFLTALIAVTKEALAEFDTMRAAEGNKLRDDIASRLCIVENYVSIIEERSPQTVEAYRQKLYKRLSDVLESTSLDEQRILQEAAIFADKTAVAEETVRLRSHISQMHQMISDGSPIGRKMDFLVQELNREANTIGSKCSDSELAKLVIEIKSEIEKIREQVQNIE